MSFVTPASIKRVFYRYELWEDFQHKMYYPQVHPSGVSAAFCILKDPEKLYHAMDYVSRYWPCSAELNLTNRGRNRQAWLGQAACCWIVDATEEETKLAWRKLTKEQQDIANGVADRVIKEWEERYAETQARR